MKVEKEERRSYPLKPPKIRTVDVANDDLFLTSMKQVKRLGLTKKREELNAQPEIEEDEVVKMKI
jgi:hypothetical protein